MKKLILCMLCLGIVMLGSAINGNADLFTDEDVSITGDWDGTYRGYDSATEEWSGYFIGLFVEDNDSEGDLRYWAEQYLGYALGTAVYDKVDPLPGIGENGFLTATVNEGGLSGTWSTVSPYMLGFYSVKAGNEWALYYVDPYQASGNWSTVHLINRGGQQAEISHLSALPEAASVPEPATMLLLGTGLIGLVGLSRQKMKR